MNSHDELNDKTEFSIFLLLGIIYKSRKSIILITMAGALGALVFSVATIVLEPDVNPLPNMYKSSSVIYLFESSSGSSFLNNITGSELGSLANLSGFASDFSYFDLVRVIVFSKSTLDIIIDEFSLVERYKIKKFEKTNTRIELRENLSVEVNIESNTISISFSDYNPLFARDVASRIIKILDLKFSELTQDPNLTKKRNLESKMAEVQIEALALESKIKEFQEEYGVVDVEVLAKQQLSTIASLRSRLILKEIEIETYENVTSLEDPTLKRLYVERNQLNDRIDELERGSSVETESSVPSQRELSNLSYEFNRLKRDLLLKEEIYSLLAQQYELVKIDEEGIAPKFQVMEYPEVPDRKSGPSRSILCIISTFLAFVFSLIYVLLKYVLQILKNDQEVRQYFR